MKGLWEENEGILMHMSQKRKIGGNYLDTFHISLWTGTETLYHRDDALLYITYVMLIWAAPIPADRWHCSLWP